MSHARRIAAVAALAALLLGWLAVHTDVLFADGLRYIAQARALAGGSVTSALKSAVDHPAYPLAVTGTHFLIGRDDPESWQMAAQLASVLAGVLLVVPLYLVTRELFGGATALPGCALVYATPLAGHVFADSLSESTFLLFWLWGLWGALKFLGSGRTANPVNEVAKSGRLRWLAVAVIGSALAYLTRPEGLLLPAALMATVILSPRWVWGHLRGSKTLSVSLSLLVVMAAIVGPYIALKGGLATKPSVARLLGTAPKSAAHAVERQRPLEPGQTAARTWGIAAKAVLKATAEAIGPPLVPFALLGLALLRLDAASARQWRLIGVIVAASLLALTRLHATGGYCSPRHAMILSTLGIPAAAFALKRLVDLAAERFRPAAWVVVAASALAVFGPQTLAPLNDGLGGYREAGHWLASNDPGHAPVVDVTGWSQFYGGRLRGYTFENLIAAAGDPSARWVVVREAHLRGPWEYCERLRALVDGREPVRVFRGGASRRPTKVYVYDRQSPVAARPDRDVRR